VTINETRYRFVVGSRAGPVGLRLDRLGAHAASIAKGLATGDRLVRSGTYRDSLTWRPGADGRGLFVEVGSDVPYARVLEHGTEAHMIFPRHPKEALWWEHGADRGWVVPDRPRASVFHPGNRPYNVIRRAIETAARGGMSV